MPPSNRLGINDNEENERSPGAFNITREALVRNPNKKIRSPGFHILWIAQ